MTTDKTQQYYDSEPLGYYEGDPELEGTVDRDYQAEYAERQDALSGTNALDATPFVPTKETLSQFQQNDVPPEQAVEAMHADRQRESVIKEIGAVVPLNRDIVQAAREKGVSAGAAAILAGNAAAVQMVSAEINRLVEEDDADNDGFLEDVGEFTYELGVSILDAGVRSVGQLIEGTGEDDEKFSDIAIVDEFNRLNREVGQAAALNFLSSKLEEAGTDVFGYQRKERLERILGGIEERGVAPIDEAFFAVDVATFGGVSLARKAATKAVSTVQRAVRSSETREKATEAIVRAADEDVALADEAGAAIVDPKGATEADGILPNRVNGATAAVDRTSRRIVKEIDEVLDSPQAGTIITPQARQELAERVVSQVTERLGRALIDFRKVETGIEKQAGIVKTEMLFGTKGGVYFRTEGNAVQARNRFREIAKEDGNLTVETKKLNENEWAVEVIRQDSVGFEDLTKMSIRDGADVGEVGVRSTFQRIRDTMSKFLGNSYERVGSQNGLQLESTTSVALKLADTKFSDNIGRLPGKEMDKLNAMITRLRDGDLAHRRDPLTEVEFEEHWMDMYNEPVSDHMMDAYRDYLDLEFVDWATKANQVLRQYLNKGYETGVNVFAGGDSKRILPAQHTTLRGVPEGTQVYNIGAGKPQAIEELPDVYKEGGVYRIAALDDEDVLYKYVINPQDDPKPLSPADVWGYNTGGHRVNPNGNYMVVIGSEGKWKTVGSAATEKQAAIWTDELNNIRGAALRGDADIDEVVANNNKFDPSITTYDEFVEWSGRHGIEARAEKSTITYKVRDEQVSTPTEDFTLPLRDVTAIRNQRQNTVLPHFGGEASAQFDPVSYVHQSSQSALSHLTRGAIAIADGESLVLNLHRKGLLSNWDEIKNMNPIGMVANAKIAVTTQEGRRAKEQLAILSSRLHVDTAGEKVIKSFSKKAAEFILNTSDSVAPKFLKDTGIFENVARRLGDPANELLHVGFLTKFGLFNASQFLMQALHVPVVVGISPRAGARASLIMPHIWSTINVSSKAAQSLALDRLAKVSGVSRTVLQEITDDVVKSGRAIIGSNAAELGTPASRGMSNFGAENYSRSTIARASEKVSKGLSKAEDASLLFFNQGEQAARLMSRVTANLEYRAKFPTKSATSEDAIRWIANRDASLSFQMTSSARAAAQRGVLKVPAQWLTYILRAHEAVFFGKSLNRGERLRTAAMLGPFWGAAGTYGVDGDDADALADYLGVEAGGAAHLTFKNGVFEGALSTLIGGDNVPNIGMRAAPAHGLYEMVKNLVEGNSAEAVAGPSGQILWSMGKPMTQAVGHLMSGNTVHSMDRALQSLRNVTSVDNAFKAYGILKYHRYTTKTGDTVPGGFDVVDAISTATGLTPGKVSRYYEVLGKNYDYGKEKRKYQKELNRMFEKAWRTGDEQLIADTVAEIKDRILISGLTLRDQAELSQNFAKPILNRAAQKYLEIPRQISDDNVDFRTEAVVKDVMKEQNVDG